jgi:hypothetical protein
MFISFGCYMCMQMYGEADPRYIEVHRRFLEHQVAAGTVIVKSGGKPGGPPKKIEFTYRSKRAEAEEQVRWRRSQGSTTSGCSGTEEPNPSAVVREAPADHPVSGLGAREYRQCGVDFLPADRLIRVCLGCGATPGTIL